MLKNIHKKRGHAIVEFSLMFFIFFILFYFLYGSWGIVHAGVLNSISARFYAFDRMGNRADLSMDVIEETEPRSYFDGGKKDIRYFAVIHEAGGKEWFSQKLNLDKIGPVRESRNSINEEQLIAKKSGEWVKFKLGLKEEENRRFKRSGMPAVHLKQGYGICLDAACGGQ